MYVTAKDTSQTSTQGFLGETVSQVQSEQPQRDPLAVTASPAFAELGRAG